MLNLTANQNDMKLPLFAPMMSRFKLEIGPNFY
jgi:hypothetical protein